MRQLVRHLVPWAMVVVCLLGQAACTGSTPGAPDAAAPGVPDAAPGIPDAAPDAPDAAPSMPDAAPDTPPCQLAEPDVFTPQVITYNQLGTEPLLFNALTSNREALAQLMDSRLHSQTFDEQAHPDTVAAYLVAQLADPWAQRVMSYLVSCALPADQSVSWHDAATGHTRTWQGERGLCPGWHERGVADDAACQELVSACLLARNNAFKREVRVSLRGMAGGQPMPLAPEVAGGVPADLASTGPCSETGAESQDPDQGCGWSVASVGTCFADTPVMIEAGDTCDQPATLRVCKGTSACDPGEQVMAATAGICDGTPLEMTCPAEESFTVMHLPSAPASVSSTLPIQAHGAQYPIDEQTLFSWREGAFYGNLLAPAGLNPRVAVQVEDGTVFYRLYDSGGSLDEEHAVYDLTCSATDMALALRLQGHERFSQDTALGDEGDVVLHRAMFACWDPGWSHGAAHAAARICAGPGAWRLCAAQAMGPCGPTADGHPGQCLSDDAGTGHGEPAAAMVGDRDYGACRDQGGTTWQHPITTVLDDPCDIVPEACGVRTDALVTSNFHTCVVLASGRIRCWGYNLHGQLGLGHGEHIGDDEPAADAGDVSMGGRVVQLATGGYHTCVLLDTGALRCWGEAEHGQLGYGNIDDLGDNPGELPATLPDVEVGGTVTRLALGEYHTCALLAGGRVRCWGDNFYGQLGYGNTEDVGNDPGEVPATAGDVDLGGVVVQLVAGSEHACVLLDTGALRCWGYNGYGQLGYGNTDHIGDDELPSAAGDVDIGGTVVQLAAGYQHTCALLDTGTVRCWGRNSHGQLGRGNTDNFGDNPGELPATGGDVDVGGRVVQIAAGGYHVCALLDTGVIRCWGQGVDGQLGYGNGDHIGDDETPASAGDVNVGAAVLQVATGSQHTCALTAAGRVRCWGRGTWGILGYGSEADIGLYDTPAEAGDVPIFAPLPSTLRPMSVSMSSSMSTATGAAGPAPAFAR